MEKLTDQINACILLLEDMRMDAEKCDRGFAGDPGIRLRACALDVSNRMKSVRADVLTLRKMKREST